jgi:hypothetical protein
MGMYSRKNKNLSKKLLAAWQQGTRRYPYNLSPEEIQNYKYLNQAGLEVKKV